MTSTPTLQNIQYEFDSNVRSMAKEIRALRELAIQNNLAHYNKYGQFTLKDASNADERTTRSA